MSDIDNKIQSAFNDLFTEPAPEEPKQTASPGQKLSRAEVFKEYQDNIRKSKSLRSEITKGVNAGEDLKELFLKAVKAISLMTDDSLYYKNIEEKIRGSK